MPTRIPVANIYYLLSYAWEHWAAGDVDDIAALNLPDATNLLAHVLNSGVRSALRRGLHRDYTTHVREFAGIRGRLLVARSKQRLLFEHGRAACAVGELNRASPLNRVLKSTLMLLGVSGSVDARIQEEIRTTLRELQDIPSTPLTSGTFRRLRVNRSNAHHTFLLALCELAFNCMLPAQGSGNCRFRDFSDDDACMHALFEDFVRNFYHARANDIGWTCLGRPRISWVAESADDASAELLPGMNTDVVLESGPRQLIMDCKFYANALKGQYVAKIDSGNLYQLWTYVSQQRRHLPSMTIEGLLLYPTVDRTFCAEYQIDGNRLRAATVNLGEHWTSIQGRLLSLLTQPAFSQIRENHG